MNIQFVDLHKQYEPLKEEILSGIEKVLDGMHLFLGENVQALEKEFAQFCGTAHGIGVSDGTAALNIILRAMDIGPGDEVITVSHTFIATTEAILLTGAKPVFVDIDPATYLMDVSQVEKKITAHNTKLNELKKKKKKMAQCVQGRATARDLSLALCLVSQSPPTCFISRRREIQLAHQPRLGQLRTSFGMWPRDWNSPPAATAVPDSRISGFGYSY